MYELFPDKKFTKSLDRLRAGKSWNEEKIRGALELLATGAPLPAVFNDHQLKGDMNIYRECHIKHDLLLMYIRDEQRKIVFLLHVGTHDDLFGK
jgi:mRNA interferase YafQ